MDSLLAVLRQLADGARGPLVHAAIDVLESELLSVVSRETSSRVPAAAAPGSPDVSRETPAPDPVAAPDPALVSPREQM